VRRGEDKTAQGNAQGESKKHPRVREVREKGGQGATIRKGLEHVLCSPSRRRPAGPGKETQKVRGDPATQKERSLMGKKGEEMPHLNCFENKRQNPIGRGPQRAG